jgi:hypothetical protein
MDDQYEVVYVEKPEQVAWGIIGRSLNTYNIEQAGDDKAQRICFVVQAPGFYKKHGYQVFGKLQNFPAGHQRYFLTKKLLLTCDVRRITNYKSPVLYAPHQPASTGCGWQWVLVNIFPKLLFPGEGVY